MLLPPPFAYAGKHKFDERQRTQWEQKERTMSATMSKKSGKGLSQGVTSELTAFFGVKPGHEEELRAACARFADHCRTLDPQAHMKTGLRDTRHVIFDNGQQLLWT